MANVLRQSLLRPIGHVIESGPDVPGGQVTTDLCKCCHCGCVWIFCAGSGRDRGFCARCNAITCGKPECDPCRPIEFQLEQMEKAAARMPMTGG